jgi:hypothetical protein
VFNKNGWRFYQNAEMIFENARVPKENVIGEGGGQSRLDKSERTGGDLFGDLELASNALGVCMAACDSALTRFTFAPPWRPTACTTSASASSAPENGNACDWTARFPNA